MTIGGAIYVIALVLSLGFVFRAGRRYDQMLQARTGSGLLGFDRALTEKYARHPDQALRQSALTRSWALILRVQEDAGVEEARREYVIALIIVIVCLFAGLALL